MRLYLAGPMSGIPQFNFPAFFAATKRLRDLGYDIVSPAELDEEHIRTQALSSSDGAPDKVDRSWGDFLSRDVKIVADAVKGIVFLPGWEKSRGARLEAFVGLLCGHNFASYDEDLGLVQRDIEWVRDRLYV